MHKYNAAKMLWRVLAIATDPETDMQGVFCSITDPSDRTINIELIRDKVDMLHR